MVDSELAKLNQVETKVSNQVVRRNISRFQVEFMFQLNQVEHDNLRSQFVTSSFGPEHRVNAYHIGASLKDAGKKTFAITKSEDKVLIQNLLIRLN